MARQQVGMGMMCMPIVLMMHTHMMCMHLVRLGMVPLIMRFIMRFIMPPCVVALPGREALE